MLSGLAATKDTGHERRNAVGVRQAATQTVQLEPIPL
jgi:hypothetical protein